MTNILGFLISLFVTLLLRRNAQGFAFRITATKRKSGEQHRVVDFATVPLPLARYHTKNNRITVMSAAVPDTSSADSSNVPNWRTIRRNHDDETGTSFYASSLLQLRPAWSQSAYDDALHFYNQLITCQDSYVAQPIAESLALLHQAYRLYGPDHVICSFNGGKDAVVILQLIRAAYAHFHYTLQQQQSKLKTRPSRPRVIYFEHEDEFPEVISFVRDTTTQYDLDMIAFETNISFPQGLSVLVDCNYFRHASECNNCNTTATVPLAICLGTRAGDPNAMDQQAFAPSSSSYMPAFMRVNAILSYSYGHVWHFLRLFQLPYCSLYDCGYTSLGTTQTTLPCPALAVMGSSMRSYWPAYMLRDWDQERAGRIVPVANNNNNNTLETNASELSHADAAEQLSETTTQQTTTNNDSDEDVVSYSSDVTTQRTVGLLVIGDEILKGYTADTNTYAAAKALRGQNVLLKRIVVVSDTIDDIVNEIERLQQEVDVIITSGGVGPTHDDITIRGVAAALGCEMELHDEMSVLLKDKMNNGDQTAELSDAQKKMATIPSASKLRYLSDNESDWPVLQCHNIFVLPGVPQFFEQKIENVAKYLSCQLERSEAYKVVLLVDEDSIVPILNRVVENHPDVCIGSYPFVSRPDYKTVITVEGRLQTKMIRSNSTVFDKDLIDQPKKAMDKKVELALDDLITTLPQGSVLRVDRNDMLL